MNKEIEKIFSIEIDEAFDKKVFETYTHALKKRASLNLNDPSYIETPYNPGASWIACKGVDENLDIKNPNWWHSYIHNEMKFMNSLDNILILDKQDTREDEEMLLRARYLIGKVWPEALKQIDIYVSDVFFYGGNGIYNAVSAWAFGALQLIYPSHVNSIDMVDYLIHEEGHLVLMAKQGFGKLLNNPNDFAYSPIRREERPLNGLIHTVFVTARVCEAMIRLEQIEQELTEEERERAIELYDYNYTVLKDAVPNLDEVASYTEIGSYFMNQLREKLSVLDTRKPLFSK